MEKLGREPRLLLYFAGTTLVLMFSPAARLLVYLFPLACVYFSFRTIRRDRGAYIQLVCWLHMLAPFVRRVVDYQSGATETVIAAAPMLALLAPPIILLRRWTKIFTKRTAPFGYVLAAILYGTFVACLRYNFSPIISVLPQWLLPVTFGLYIFSERLHREEMYLEFERAMVWGTILCGAYGLLQYFVLPPWDQAWMESVELVTLGKPEALMLRIFGTLNSPQILAAFLMAGILVAYHSHVRGRLPALMIGFTALALSQVRSSWFGLIAGVLFILLRATPAVRLKAVRLSGVCVGALLVAMVIPAFHDTVAARFIGLTEMQNDYSVADRHDTYVALYKEITEAPFGRGINVDDVVVDAEHDSSVINILLCLGVFGAAMFLFGVGMIAVKLFLYIPTSEQTSILTLQALTFALFIEFPINNIVSGPIALLLWAGLSFGASFITSRTSLEAIGETTIMRLKAVELI